MTIVKIHAADIHLLSHEWRIDFDFSRRMLVKHEQVITLSIKNMKKRRLFRGKLYRWTDSHWRDEYSFRPNNEDKLKVYLGMQPRALPKVNEVWKTNSGNLALIVNGEHSPMMLWWDKIDRDYNCCAIEQRLAQRIDISMEEFFKCTHE